MAAKQFWRLTKLAATGLNGLELTEVHLLAGVSRVDVDAAFLSSVAPATGSLASLLDDDLSTGAGWGAADVSALSLMWDFGGAPVEVTNIRLGSAEDRRRFLLIACLECSDDGVTWDRVKVIAGIAWPGSRSSTASRIVGHYDRAAKILGLVFSEDSRHALVGGSYNARGDMARSSGVYQFEMEADAQFAPGVCEPTATLSGPTYASNLGWAMSTIGPIKINANISTAYGPATSSPVGSVIGVVVDFSAGTLTFYRNGVSLGVAFTTLAGKTLLPSANAAVSTNPRVLLRSSNFTYPVAGALPWAADDELINQSVVQGSAATPEYGTLTASQSAELLYPSRIQLIGVAGGGRGVDLTGALGRGVGRIKGTTKDKGSPNVAVSARVRLYRQRDGLLIREVWSAKGTGVYSFDYIDEIQTYTVISYDYDGVFRAVVADGLTLANEGVELIA